MKLNRKKWQQSKATPQHIYPQTEKASNLEAKSFKSKSG
jgi:hypothetical protein